MNWSLETPRLRLCELNWDDLDFIAEMLADPEVMRFYPKCYSRDEATGWLQRQLTRYADHGHGLWLVRERAGAAPVGQVGLLRQSVDGVRESEVGYLIHRPYWRRGYATEAAAAVRDYAFDTLVRPGVVSLIRPQNLPSQGVAAKLGMQPRGYTGHAGIEHIVFALARSGKPSRQAKRPGNDPVAPEAIRP